MRCISYSAILIILAFHPPSARAQDQPQNPPLQAFRPLPSVTLPPELDGVLRDYEAAWQAGNANALASLFTEDGLVQTRSGWVQGHEDIATAYQNASGELKLRAVSYAVQDTVGYIIGAYRYGEETEDRGKFILALRRAPNKPWLIAADLDRGN